MGTRALIHIKEAGLNSTTLVTIYKHYDGYPLGLGQQIIDILNNGDTTIGNGVFKNEKAGAYFNGMGCLAAYVIGALKTQIGDVYIYPLDSKNVSEEFTYTLFRAVGLLMLQVTDVNNISTVGLLHANFFKETDE